MYNICDTFILINDMVDLHSWSGLIRNYGLIVSLVSLLSKIIH
jgi:hypothetical protein